MPRFIAGSAIERTGAAKNPGTATPVSGTSVALVADNKDRVELTIINDDNTDKVVYLRLGTGSAVLNTGIRINPGGGSFFTSAYTGPVQAISTGTDVPVLVTEV
jgi:hypothetical protein